MTKNPDALVSADRPPLLETALEKNEEVKEKVENSANELSSINEAVRKEMAADRTVQQVAHTLTRKRRCRRESARVRGRPRGSQCASRAGGGQPRGAKPLS